ncbi:D-alanyl-D-alanine carboxypeptidase family protein [Streptomyces sp. NBC_00932]|uniref:D-alanyl-D-alanine carboxypeptidase family protein n=1 Tax=Streptomyces sp. NBC_00932 TaxID=2903690 RepID=UPI00386B0812|nr:D-alanyl-D-alanine carboxypeptidase [Streptomyces sp. NBC_00932]
MPAVEKTAKRTVLTVIAAALLPALCAVPASAATATGPKPSAAESANTAKSPESSETSKSSEHSKSPGKTSGPSKPARSQIGGARLGRTGTQVQLGPGAPVLPKDLSGESWIVADAESGDVLASHDAHRRLAPASTLKMLLADTLLPKFPATETHKVLPSDLAGMGEGSSLVGIKENLTYTVHDLWLGVFLRSGNDAVHVLSAMNDGVPKTVRDMQAHADDLQALDTHVVSPDGYDEPGQVSSAYDLTLFARSGLQKKDFRTYCSTATAQFPGMKKKGKKRETFGIQNTNRLLTGADGVTQYKGIAGVKNGNTTHAGATYTAVAERDGHVLLVTVMKPSSTESQAVYKEAARLLDWGFASEGKVTPVGELVAPASSAAGSGGKAKSGGATQDGKDGAGATGKDKASAPAAASQKGGSSGVGTALAISAGALLLLAAAVFLVNRRWPLPGLVRRSPRR